MEETESSGVAEHRTIRALLCFSQYHNILVILLNFFFYSTMVLLSFAPSLDVCWNLDFNDEWLWYQ